MRALRGRRRVVRFHESARQAGGRARCVRRVTRSAKSCQAGEANPVPSLPLPCPNPQRPSSVPPSSPRPDTKHTARPSNDALLKRPSSPLVLPCLPARRPPPPARPAPRAPSPALRPSAVAQLGSPCHARPPAHLALPPAGRPRPAARTALGRHGHARRRPSSRELECRRCGRRSRRRRRRDDGKEGRQGLCLWPDPLWCVLSLSVPPAWRTAERARRLTIVGSGRPAGATVRYPLASKNVRRPPRCRPAPTHVRAWAG